MPRTARVLSIAQEREGRYLITSTRGDEITEHWVDPNRLLCDCEAARRRRNGCAHLDFVLAHLEDGCRTPR
jgi:hypothetical protein